jgi:SAM-dependent methyltransferase
VTSRHYLDEAMTGEDPPGRVLDLGCGVGRTIDTFRAHDPDIEWVGVDIEGSPEVEARIRQDGHFVTFDGINLPFRDGAFPLVYSHQVLEHVPRPYELVAEVGRVLEPGGTFIGSTSQMEPYHSYSLWNYTVYGFRTIVEAAGLVLEEVRPSLDGFTLTRRAYDGRPPAASRWWGQESPVNQEIDQWGADTDQSHARINARKLEFCGQFAFRVRKPVPAKRLPLHRRGRRLARRVLGRR